MKVFSQAIKDALASEQLVARDFLWITVKDRTTGSPASFGWWSDVGTRDALVVNPFTQVAESRSFKGAGELISIGAIPAVANLTVQTVRIRASQIGDANDKLRAYDAKHAPIEVFRGLFEIGTLNQVDAAQPRFIGFVDEMEIQTPEAGGEGFISLNCKSATQDMMRGNAAIRSDAWQKRRVATDTFRRHAAVVQDWELVWGAEA